MLSEVFLGFLGSLGLDSFLGLLGFGGLDGLDGFDDSGCEQARRVFGAGFAARRPS